jgi:uncharacterized protein
MFGKWRISHWLIGAVILAALECASLAVVELVVWTAPAQAQWFRDDRYQNYQQRRRSGGFFQDLFGPYHPREREYEPYRRPRSVDHSRAPPPRKAEKGAPPPTTSIVVMGDGMADWLAYGLEDAFSDTPSVGIVRKIKLHSGLIRYEPKSDLDWWHQARDMLSQEKANYVVMMLGLNDRENIRESDVAKEAEKQKAEKEAAEKKKEEKNGNEKGADKDKKGAEEKKKEAEAPKPKPSNGVIPFRSDRWAAIYAKRIDETIAALKSKGVPVFWVGLPSIRGTKSTADAVYLNDLFRARAERAGIVYVDVWDGFVDDAGKYSSFGPDYEGQIRRLRSSDGVFFTKYGARKLAHYVEREIRRYMSNRSLQVTLPTGPTNVPKGGKSKTRPVVGPVVPLTGTTGAADELLGASGTRPPHGDSVAARVLVNGEAVAPQAGRADDFAWPPGSPTKSPPAPAAGAHKPAAGKQSSLAPPAAPATAQGKRPVRIIEPAQPNSAPQKESDKAQSAAETEETAQNANEPRPAPQTEAKPRPTHNVRHREPLSFPFHFKNPFNFFH